MKMKWIICLLVGFSSFAQEVAYRPSETRLFKLINTELNLEPDFAKNQLKGTATITLKPWFYPQDFLELDAIGFDILSVKQGDQDLKFTYDQKKLGLYLNRKFLPSELLKISISYVAKPDEIAKNPLLAEVKEKGLYFVDPTDQKPEQVWTQGETEFNSCWFPTLDAPNQKHTQLVKIKVRDDYKTLSNGILRSSDKHKDGTRTDTWEMDLPHSVYLTMMAAGNFEKVVDSSFTDFELSYYVEPKFKKEALEIFGRTPQMIKFFETKLGIKYPWQKYAQIAVRDYISGAMENTTATVHGHTIQKPLGKLMDENDDGVIAHELFHHWFGDLVTAESWANLPLNESFANYSEYLWAENFKGNEEAQWQNYLALNEYLNEADEKQVPLIRYYYDDAEEMFDRHSYNKGGRVLHMLRKEVGDEAFFASLHYYLSQNKFENTEIFDLKKAFEYVTGRDLQWFFDQWFMKPGHPRIHTSHTYEDGILKLSTFQQIDSINTLVYQLPMTLEIGTDTGSYFKTIELNQQVQEFQFQVEKAPVFVHLDPYGDVLAVIDQEQTMDEKKAIALRSKGVIARVMSLESISTDPSQEQNPVYDVKIREVALAALKDPFWRIRQIAAEKFADYDGDDFLEVENALQSLIRTDESNLVKATAIRAMKNFLNAQNDLLFRKALQEPSFALKAAALEAILVNSPADADSLASAMENIEDVEIFAAIGNYRSENPKPEHYDWFVKRLSEFSGVELYQVLGTFGAYLISSDEDNQQKSIPFLKEIALHEGIWVGRFAATQALVLLIEQEEAMNALKEIVANEKDEQLQSVYKQIPLAP